MAWAKFCSDIKAKNIIQVTKLPSNSNYNGKNKWFPNDKHQQFLSDDNKFILSCIRSVAMPYYVRSHITSEKWIVYILCVSNYYSVEGTLNQCNMPHQDQYIIVYSYVQVFHCSCHVFPSFWYVFVVFLCSFVIVDCVGMYSVVAL